MKFATLVSATSKFAKEWMATNKILTIRREDLKDLPKNKLKKCSLYLRKEHLLIWSWNIYNNKAVRRN